MQHTSVTDAVRRAQSGDHAAFTDLVGRYQDAVFGAAYHGVLDFDTARDIAQETFIRAWEHLGEVRDPERFPAWLLRICRNLAASWRRRPARNAEGLMAEDARVDGPDECIGIRDIVTRALSSLPSDNRLALTLFLVNGYSYAEVAHLTDVPETTVKGRIERGRRQLAAEVLMMTEETLKKEAPDEQFTVETVRRAVAEARDAMDANEMGTALSIADRVLEQLPDLDVDDFERRDLTIEALGVVQGATWVRDRQRWTEAGRRAIRALEEQGDRGRLARCLADLGIQANDLTQSERSAIAEYCLQLYEELGMDAELRTALFFRGWSLAWDGQSEAALQRWRRARELRERLAYDCWAACLDATDEFIHLAGTHPDAARAVVWGAGASIGRIDGERLRHVSGPGWMASSSTRAEAAAAAYGLWPFPKLGWLPVTGPDVGYEEEQTTFSYTTRPTHTRIGLEAVADPVLTPAGEFTDCLLVRGTMRQAPEDHDTESREARLNRHWCGEWYWWFSRGVGPVAFRHEAEDGVVAHAVLSAFECPERRDEWFPLVVGARWEYQPANPPDGIQVASVVKLTDIDLEADTVYLPRMALAMRTSE